MARPKKKPARKLPAGKIGLTLYTDAALRDRLTKAAFDLGVSANSLAVRLLEVGLQTLPEPGEIFDASEPGPASP